MKSSQVRDHFIQYFKRQGHVHVPSSSLIPENDPTLLFANAGMNQFKNLFLGLEDRGYKRAVTSQKCVRAGGKHNDLDNVGFTARHHTFFEMLGNFSFGDYFKKDAIHFAWELLTKEFQIPKDKLYVTVFETDDEAADIWHKQEGVPRDRIFRLGEKDNFWRMGDIGPCGPSSEIFFDHGPKAGKESDPYKGILSGEDRFIEIWNLVFMQFDETSPGQLTPLPRPSVDTGSGLERVVAALQGHFNNYDTDLFAPMIETGCKISGLDYVRDPEVLKSKQNLFDQMAALRVLADHSRSVGFLIADGALPSNEGRGYVLRRILRRALRFGRKIAPNQSIFPSMVESLIQSMSSVYPELSSRKDHVLSTVRDEETRFLSTLDQGTEILHSELAHLQKSGKKILPGEVVFKLYDTFGFPSDLTQLMSQEKGFQTDISGFEAKMSEAKQKAKSSWKGKGLNSDEAHLIQWSQEVSKLKGPTKFVGYDTLHAESKVLSLSNGKASAIHLTQGQGGHLVTAETPFYSEGGGQVGDVGEIYSHGQLVARVLNCIKKFDLHIHEIEVLTDLKVNDPVELRVELAERRLTASNHSATHLLHSALRKVLGSHVTQAGSLVDSRKTRFDFTHNKALSREEVQKIEDLVNEQIRLALHVGVEMMGHKQALEKGAMALFGEKYGEEVRVLSMGSFSCELCGGTHVKNTAEIGLFKIVSESGVSAGVRRIEALTSQNAFNYLNHLAQESLEAKRKAGLSDSWDAVLEKAPESLPMWIDKKMEEIKGLERELKKSKVSSLNVDEIFNGKTSFSLQGQQHELCVGVVPSDDRDALAQFTDQLKSKIKSGLVVTVGEGPNGARPLIVSVTSNLTPKIHAGNLIKTLSGKFGGKGGGRPDFAQGSLGTHSQKDIQSFLIEELSK